MKKEGSYVELDKDCRIAVISEAGLVAKLSTKLTLFSDIQLRYGSRGLR